MFPIDKYKFYTDNNENPSKVYAISSFAGKTVRGTAKCDSKDTFSQEKGKELAAARCAVKIAKKRLARASKKLTEACAQRIAARKYETDMTEYYLSANEELFAANEHLDNLLAKM